MKVRHCIQIASVSLTPFLVGGCGTRVPAVGEIWDDDTGTYAIPTERKIKEKIYCELNKAVTDLNNDRNLITPVIGPDPKHKGKQQKLVRKPVPESWGATLTLTLTVEEMSSLTPSVSLNTPLKPQDTHFPGNITVPGPQSFNIGFGAALTSDATRYDKYTFFYKVTSLEGYNGACNYPESPDQRAPVDFSGSSLLLESDLGIERWLRKMSDIRTGIGVSDTNSDKSSAQVLTYDIKFDILSSGSVTPTWKLTPITTPTGTLPLFSAKRERTHEMILTLGPLAPSKDQPSQLAINDALAAQIGSAVGAAVNRALNQ